MRRQREQVVGGGQNPGSTMPSNSFNNAMQGVKNDTFDVKTEVKQENGGGDNSSDVKQESSDATSRLTESTNASAPPKKPRVKKGKLMLNY